MARISTTSLQSRVTHRRSVDAGASYSVFGKNSVTLSHHADGLDRMLCDPRKALKARAALLLKVKRRQQLSQRLGQLSASRPGNGNTSVIPAIRDAARSIGTLPPVPSASSRAYAARASASGLSFERS